MGISLHKKKLCVRYFFAVRFDHNDIRKHMRSGAMLKSQCVVRISRLPRCPISVNRAQCIEISDGCNQKRPTESARDTLHTFRLLASLESKLRSDDVFDGVPDRTHRLCSGCGHGTLCHRFSYLCKCRVATDRRETHCEQ